MIKTIKELEEEYKDEIIKDGEKLKIIGLNGESLGTYIAHKKKKCGINSFKLIKLKERENAYKN